MKCGGEKAIWLLAAPHTSKHANNCTKKEIKSWDLHLAISAFKGMFMWSSGVKEKGRQGRQLTIGL